MTSSHFFSVLAKSFHTVRLIVVTILSAHPLEIGAYDNTVCHLFPWYSMNFRSTRAEKHVALWLTSVLGAPEGCIISFSMNFLTSLAVAVSVALMKGQPVRCLSLASSYCFFLVLRGSTPAKFTEKMSNTLLWGKYSDISYGASFFIPWKTSQFFTYFASSFKKFGHQNRSVTRTCVAFMSQVPSSLCRDRTTLSQAD